MSNAASHSEQFRRLVIGFRDASSTPAELEAVARFAQALQSQLFGVFFEDESLAQWCDSPLLRQFRGRSPMARPIGAGELAEEFAAAATMMRRRLDKVAAAFGLRSAFAIERGRVAALGALPAEPGDIEVVIEPADPLARMSYPFTAVLRTIERTKAPVLYVPHRTRHHAGPVVSVNRAEETGPLAIATEIARLLGEEIVRKPIEEILSPASERPTELGRRPPAPTAARQTQAAQKPPTAERLIVIERGVLPADRPLLFAAIAAMRMVPVLIAGGDDPAATQ